MIYAELLSNIRQISVIATLPPPSGPQVTAKLSSSRDLLEVSCDGQTDSIRLPALVDSRFQLPSPGPRSGNGEISWRLPVDRSSARSEDGDAASAPWPASKLSEMTQLACQKCGSVIVGRGNIQAWKDLPSENWAEMMDFWHCHKPHNHSKNGSNGNISEDLDNRGYGANTKFTAKPGVGFVDLTYFLISEKNCTGIKLFPPALDVGGKTGGPELLHCASCDGSLGVFDHLACGNRLYKWSLDVFTDNNDLAIKQHPSPPLSYFITAHLLSQIAAQAVHHFILYCPSSDSTPILYVWVFMAKLAVSFSASPQSPAPPSPIPATKVFFQRIEKTQMTNLLDKGGLTIEEIKLPAEVMTELGQVLVDSNDRLPQSAKKFKQWDVGLMERFEPVP